MFISDKKLVFTLSAPSGCGKTTVSKEILRKNTWLVRAISVNTRKKRPGEVDGQDYIFVEDQVFEQWVQEGRFIEHVEIYNAKKGLLRSSIMQNIANNKNTLCIVDYRGMCSLKSAFGDDVVSIFLVPPSLGELEKRIKNRKQDSLAEIKLRLERASHEISLYKEYDYCIVNDHFGKCVHAVKSIFDAERYRTSRFT
ncbi:MAG: guanylate kinase [Holosporales bacterium]|jgi:guanylate kinase|nr:guanylate kinase [Holosporales bacterium]